MAGTFGLDNFLYNNNTINIKPKMFKFRKNASKIAIKNTDKYKVAITSGHMIFKTLLCTTLMIRAESKQFQNDAHCNVQTPVS